MSLLNVVGVKVLALVPKIKSSHPCLHTIIKQLKKSSYKGIEAQEREHQEKALNMTGRQQ